MFSDFINRFFKRKDPKKAVINLAIEEYRNKLGDTVYDVVEFEIRRFGRQMHVPDKEITEYLKGDKVDCRKRNKKWLEVMYNDFIVQVEVVDENSGK